VRREAAYALGQTKSHSATNALTFALTRDKIASVRAAAAVALGEIGDAMAVPALALAIVRRAADAQLNAASTAQVSTKFRREKDEFVRRAAAKSLGQLKDSRATSALIGALNDKDSSDDLKRESAAALGEIGDARSVPALEAAVAARDPYLSRIASEAVKKIVKSEK
jgi:HEAT repeat protein